LSRTLELAVAVAMAAGASVAFSLPCRASPVPDTVAVDSVFARYATDTGPGCVIGISQAGRTLLTRAYGMANLENDVPNTVGTIFEAGSISKQFTAAATLLLVARGRLALDSDIRSWFPELPDYGDTIAVYHLLHHTSGLRDWGVVSGIGGWPRSSRTVSNAHVLAIIARQRALNHPVGAQYSYSNSNYNLLVLLVERITGEPFAEFTRRELFAPLGMIHTEWRDDYARLVSQRAQAYAPDGRTWRLDMPFENAYGHGGLLTTVADLLRWNDALTAHRVGDPDVSRLLVAPGRLRDGTPIDYACGIVVRVEREVQEIFHGGATAGYRGFLARYPAQDASVAVLCNAADADPTALGQGAVAGMVPFGPPAPPAPAPPEGPAAPFGLDPKTVPDFLGTWQSEEAEASYRIRSRGDTLQVVRWPGDGAMLRPTGPDRFAVGPMELRFERDTAHRVVRLLVSVPRALNVEFVRVSGP
jgi:CubicO group peptidase (beta-lactamase class C family)